MFETKKLESGELDRVALVHGDHVLVVTYDYFNSIRSINVYKPYTNKGEKVVNCPVCGLEISFNLCSSSICEYAIVHDDHVLIIYATQNNYFLEEVRMVKEVQEIRKENTLSQIINEIGIELTAYIMYKVVIDELPIIIVPAKVQDMFEKLFKGSESLSRIKVISGLVNAHNVNLSNFGVRFFINFLQQHKNLSDPEFINRLDYISSFLRKMKSNPINIIDKGDGEINNNQIFPFLI